MSNFANNLDKQLISICNEKVTANGNKEHLEKAGRQFIAGCLRPYVTSITRYLKHKDVDLKKVGGKAFANELVEYIVLLAETKTSTTDFESSFNTYLDEVLELTQTNQ